MSKLLWPFKFIIKFVKETVEEGKKSVWPTRAQTINQTAMVVASVSVGVLIFAGFDWLVQKGLIYLITK